MMASKSRKQRKLENARRQAAEARARRKPVSRGMVAAVVLSVAFATGPSQAPRQERHSQMHAMHGSVMSAAPIALVQSAAPRQVDISFVRYRSWIGERIERSRARLAALEKLLLRDIAGDATLAARLANLAFESDAERALTHHVLGAAYMRSLNERLSTLVPEPTTEDCSGIVPFQLYGPVDDGLGDAPTPEGIEAWTEMRHRLLRKQSELGRRLPSAFLPSPRRFHPRTVPNRSRAA